MNQPKEYEPTISGHTVVLTGGQNVDVMSITAGSCIHILVTQLQIS